MEMEGEMFILILEEKECNAGILVVSEVLAVVEVRICWVSCWSYRGHRHQVSCLHHHCYLFNPGHRLWRQVFKM